MNNYAFLLLFVVFGLSCQKQITNSFTLKSERERFYAEKNLFVDSVFQFLPHTTNEIKYQSAFWASELMLRKSALDSANLIFACENFTDFSKNFKRSVLQHIYTLYPHGFKLQLDSLIRFETDAKRFAIMANYLIRLDSTYRELTLVLKQKKFNNWHENPILRAMYESFSDSKPLSETQIAELIAFRSKSNQASFFVFVSKNRDLPGYLLIQNKQGEILKHQGTVLKFKLLARSITNMPEYITNGNTPQGVYSIQGIGSSDNVFIGKTPTVISVLPFETSLSRFSFGKLNGGWTLAQYNRFFPVSWSNYLPKNRAYYAGQAGRTEIILHGTTINPEYYKQQIYYPFTPSLGCLCLLERWDSKHGLLIESDQLRLIKTLKHHNIKNAFMYVIEI